MLFDGLMTQSEIDRLLDELFDDLEGTSVDEAGSMVLTLYEEGERENADHAALLAG